MLKKILYRSWAQLKLILGDTHVSWSTYKDFIKIHPSAIIDHSSSLKIFNPPKAPEICLTIDEGSHVFSKFSLLRPQSKIRIGKNCQLGNSHFICAESIEVGDDVLMAWGVTIIDTDSHALAWEGRQKDVRQCYEDYKTNPDNFIKNKDWANVEKHPIIIGNKSWIGFNVIILPGVRIGDESVVGAGSVVTRDVTSNTIVAGNPAKEIRR